MEGTDGGSKDVEEKAEQRHAVDEDRKQSNGECSGLIERVRVYRLAFPLQLVAVRRVLHADLD